MNRSRTDYEAINGRGKVVYSFDSLDLACRFWDAHAHEHVGLSIQRVERREYRTTIIRPADESGPQLRLVRGRP